MKPHSKAQYLYLKLMRFLGLGNRRSERNPKEWANSMQNYLHNYCFYHTRKDIYSLWFKYFQKTPERWESDHMLYRIKKHAKLKGLYHKLNNKIGKWFLQEICRRRATSIFAVYK